MSVDDMAIQFVGCDRGLRNSGSLPPVRGIISNPIWSMLAIYFQTSFPFVFLRAFPIHASCTLPHDHRCPIPSDFLSPPPSRREGLRRRVPRCFQICGRVGTSSRRFLDERRNLPQARRSAAKCFFSHSLAPREPDSDGVGDAHTRNK